MQPILMVDLSTGQTDFLQVPESWTQHFVGGASLAARLLFNELTRDLDALSPEAPLCFMNGPLSGTAGPAVGRFVVCGKSPATHLWGESNCGGFWGVELRKAGFDGLLIRGRARAPVYLVIQDGEVTVRPASHLWGMETYQAQQAIQSELPVKGASIAVIGPAGEAQIPFSLIFTDHGRVAGRTGLGAVMGSKNLKAIVVKGSRKVPVIDVERYQALRTAVNQALRNDAFSTVLRELGTAGGAEYFDYLGMMPKQYYSRERSDEPIEVTGANLTEKFLKGVSACHACVIACGRVVQLPEEALDSPVLHKGRKQKGPEYETMMGFGPNLGINDLEFISRAGDFCDRFGVDSISVSNVIGLAFRLYELGIITLKDTDGIELNWGNKSAVEKLLLFLKDQQGIGRILAQGARALGEAFGAADEAMQVNGLETAYHDPRGASGMALVYATSPRGACHNQSDYYLVEVGQVEPSIGLERHGLHDGVEKAFNVIRHQDWRTLCNALVMCFFSNVAPESVHDLLSAACGTEWTIDGMLEAGERGFNLKRLINFRLGLRRQNDTLPKRMMQPYLDEATTRVPDFQAMLRAYYQQRGWDVETGFPTESKLASLGLSWALESFNVESAQEAMNETGHS